MALVLGIVAALSWSSVFSYELERLDERLCNEARRFAYQPPPPNDLERVKADIAPKLRLQSATQVLLRPPISGGTDAVLDGSSTPRPTLWPADLDPDRLNWEQSSNQKLIPDPAARPPRPPRENNEPPPPPGSNQQPRRLDVDLGVGVVEGRPPPRAVCERASFTASGSDWRAARIQTIPPSTVVAANLAATRDELQSALRQIAIRSAPLSLVLTALGAWFLSALAMRPVNRLRNTMETVHEKALDQRLPLDREDHEFRALIGAYNRMLERLELSFHQAARFSADAAHELRTPLTILQGQIEQAMHASMHGSMHELMNGSSSEPMQIQLAQMLDEVGRLANITRKLLLLSQADAGKLALVLTPVDLRSMLDARLSDGAMSGLNQLNITYDLATDITVQADEQLLSQLLNNLFSNAFKYTQQDGWIKVVARARPAGKGVEVLISNSTDAITPEVRPRFFDRFFRGDVAHNRSIDGHGLGLSLSREIARAHGGDLTLEPSIATEVILRLSLPNNAS